MLSAFCRASCFWSCTSKASFARLRMINAPPRRKRRRRKMIKIDSPRRSRRCFTVTEEGETANSVARVNALILKVTLIGQAANRRNRISRKSASSLTCPESARDPTRAARKRRDITCSFQAALPARPRRRRRRRRGIPPPPMDPDAKRRTASTEPSIQPLWIK